MTKLKEIFSGKKGNSYPLVIAIALAIVMLSCVAYEYIRLTIIAQGVRDGVQSAIISVATDNYDDTYAALREGYSGGYVNEGSGWDEQLDLGEVYERLNEVLGLDASHTKSTGPVLEYRLSNLSVTVINTPFAPSDPDTAQEFLAEASIHIEVPLSFGWSALPPMETTLLCKAGYTPRF